ncbi:dTDP-4-dehydrorhamnose reductase [Sphingosinicella rhizophila]|uniref:dTDP-4-dehydrorhamnose reductase n=1 Tax=Sphingosinicella rhizophila TaxID=3050082 RepID=A0ABU3Q8F9_9SPHN|nr:dTDP-4-dehydrorhamnose reductase [Sphingosinicella sp. GR2756]MDT9599693.1 dTDP-4-dehydrorhamnose reductase [Sphingosinicella sp. GR2756]
MKILVTGREGQLVRSLIERAGGISGVSLVPFGRPQLDLERTESIAPIVAEAAPDVIINAAAFTAVDLAEEQPERAALLNEAAPAALAEAARRIGAPMVHISTDYVFDGASPVPYGEQASPHPLGVYGRTKLAGEDKVRKANADHVIVRTSWVYSPFGRNFLKTMMALAKSQEEVAVVGDQHGNPTSAMDLADGLLTMIRAWRSGRTTGLGETYHLAGSGHATWFDFAALIMRESARLGQGSAKVRRIRTSEWPTRARRPANSLLDCSKFESHFGFRMPAWEISARATIERLLGEPAAA